jgi:hypothetical protein
MGQVRTKCQFVTKLLLQSTSWRGDGRLSAADFYGYSGTSTSAETREAAPVITVKEDIPIDSYDSLLPKQRQEGIYIAKLAKISFTPVRNETDSWVERTRTGA